MSHTALRHFQPLDRTALIKNRAVGEETHGFRPSVGHRSSHISGSFLGQFERNTRGPYVVSVPGREWCVCRGQGGEGASAEGDGRNMHIVNWAGDVWMRLKWLLRMNCFPEKQKWHFLMRMDVSA